MNDKSRVIFGNRISDRDYNKALKSKKNYIKKYGDDSSCDYKANVTENKVIGPLLGVENIEVSTKVTSDKTMDTQKGIIVGNIRMGFGHYRISMAMASYAHHLGYIPYWMDLSFTHWDQDFPRILFSTSLFGSLLTTKASEHLLIIQATRRMQS